MGGQAPSVSEHLLGGKTVGLGEERPKDEKREEASDNMPCRRQLNKSNVVEIETMVKFPPLVQFKTRGKKDLDSENITQAHGL